MHKILHPRGGRGLASFEDVVSALTRRLKSYIKKGKRKTNYSDQKQQIAQESTEK